MFRFRMRATGKTKTQTLRSLAAGPSHLVMNCYHPTTSPVNSRDRSALNLEGPYLSYLREAKN